MRPSNEADQLERLMPMAMSVLFQGSGDDPLRHFPVGQVRLLRALMDGKQSASQLAEGLGLSPSSLSQMSARLIASGLVEKTGDLGDRRVRMLGLTSAGFDLMNSRRQIRVRSAASVLDAIGPERTARLIGLMNDIVHSSDRTVPSEALV